MLCFEITNRYQSCFIKNIFISIIPISNMIDDKQIIIARDFYCHSRNLMIKKNHTQQLWQTWLSDCTWFSVLFCSYIWRESRIGLFCQTRARITYVSLQLALRTPGTRVHSRGCTPMPRVCTRRHSGQMLQIDTDIRGLVCNLQCPSGWYNWIAVQQLRHPSWCRGCHWGRCGGLCHEDPL